MTQREYLILLNMLPNFGMKKYEKVLKLFGSLEVLFKSSRTELEKNGLNDSLIEDVTKSKSVNVEEELEKCRKAGVKIVTYLDDNYPAVLRHIYSPPLVLYFKGEYKVEDQIALAIVGSRRASIYGKITAEKLAGELVKREISVISGLARGIDSSAHRGALKEKGRTIAVLGSGLERIYPPENKRLAQEISESGLLVSEFSYTSPPNSFHFPRRNRLISGFSLGTVVVEAALKSGALITVSFALDQGKEVFAVPGNINSATSAGSHQLIKDGAKMVVDIEDILEEYKYRFPNFSKDPVKKDVKETAGLSGAENEIFSLISEESDVSVHIDEIIRSSRLNAGETAGFLFNLELKGLIRQLSGKRFIRAG